MSKVKHVILVKALIELYLVIMYLNLRAQYLSYREVILKFQDMLEE